jgi:hypothetical protein
MDAHPHTRRWPNWQSGKLFFSRSLFGIAGLLKQNLRAREISAMIARGESVGEEYITQARLYHPELFATAVTDS